MSMTIQTIQDADLFQGQATARGATSVGVANLSDSITTLSPALTAAEEAVPQMAGFRPAFRSDALSGVLPVLGQVMAQGQGAYVVGFSSPSGGMMAAVSPRDLARMVNGSYMVATMAAPLSVTLRAALAQVANPAPALSVTMTAPKTADAQFALALLARTPVPDPAATSSVAAPTNPGYQANGNGWEIQTVDPTNGSSLTLIYIPPGDATTQDTRIAVTAAQTADPTNAKVDLVA